MPWGAVAGAAISGAATLYGSSKQSKAVKDAQNSADALNREAMAYQQQAAEQQRADLQPYSSAGLPALGAQNALLGLNGPDAANAAMANFRQNPAYQFQMEQGLRAIDAGAASRGMLRSGATMQAEQTFGANLANASFDTYYNRLMDMTRVGQNSAAGVGAAGMQAANGQANVLGTMAQTATSAGTAQASIYGNTAAGIGNAVNQGLQNYQYGQAVNGGAGGSIFGGTQAPNKLMGGNGGSKYAGTGSIY